MADTDLSRRGFLGGMGAAAVTLLFRRKLDRVLAELTAESEAELEAAPAAADIRCMPQRAFRADRLVVPAAIAPFFVIENITIGGVSQFSDDVGGVPADMFSPTAFDGFMNLNAAAAGTEIAFRVRYVGDDPMGMPFTAALLGYELSDPTPMRIPSGDDDDDGFEILTQQPARRAVLPISSGMNIVA